MSALNKYTFDVEFRTDGEQLSAAARARQKKSYTAEEIEQLCADARVQGMQAGQVRAAEALAAETAKLASVLRDLLTRSHQATNELSREAALLALAAARKLASAAIGRLPAAEVEMTLRSALHNAIGEPRIVLKASQRVVDALKPELEDIARQEGFDGRIALAADPAFSAADCRIEWRGGGAERSQAAIETALAELITRRFANSPSVED